MRKLALNIDSDCIIADMWGFLLSRTNEAFGTSFTTEDVVNYNIHECPAFKKEGQEFMQRLLNLDGTFARFDPYPGALEALEILNDKFDVTICTSYAWSSDTCANDKLAWYKKHAPFLGVKQLLLGHPKFKIMCDISIDDGPDKQRKYKAAQPWAHLMSIRWPYHADAEDVFDFLAEGHKNPAKAWEQLLFAVDHIDTTGDRKEFWNTEKVDLSRLLE